MIKEFQAFFTLFKQGRELSNAAAWKNRQIAGNALTGLLTACMIIANGFGYHIQLDGDLLSTLGAGIAALYTAGNIVLTVITSKKVGLKAKELED